MKRIICCILLGMLFIVSLTGCGDGQPQSSENNETPETMITNEQEENKKTVFEQFEEGLKNLNIQYEKVPMASDLLGAKEGVKYKTSNGNIEIYLFEDGDTFNKVKANKSVEMEGFGSFPVLINGNLVMLEDSSIGNDIINLFNSVK